MNLLQPLKLLLPALIPSWNFFDVITPSPRIEFCLLISKEEAPSLWKEFRPRPEHLTIPHSIKRLFWNAKWNESLFLTSCAERILQCYTPHSENEILKRIEKELIQGREKPVGSHLQFRLLLLSRKGEKTNTETAFTSRIHNLIDNTKYEP